MFSFKRSGNGIIAAASPWITGSDPFKGKPASLEWTMLHNSLHSVGRATGDIPAGRWQIG